MALGMCLTDDLFLRRLGRDVFFNGLGVVADLAVDDWISPALVLEEADTFGTELVLSAVDGSRFWNRSYFARLFGGSFATIVVSYMFDSPGRTFPSYAERI
jgi:hypothetical protein